MSEETTPQIEEEPVEPQAEAAEDPVLAALKQVDLNSITKDDVFVDLIHQSKLHAFRLMVAAQLLEQLIIKERSNEGKEPVQEEQQSN